MTTMDEKFCVKWTNFSENNSSTFLDLHNYCPISDVTLVCEDGTQVQAHKIILSASSPVLRNLLMISPVIFMKGMKSLDLTAVVDFMYHGEVSVSQDDLESFLAVSEELQLKGLGPTAVLNTTKEVIYSEFF